MKKTLVALALAAFASTSYASVAGSAHDFNASASYNRDLASRCQYCHVPHKAATWGDTALWAIKTEPTVSAYYTQVSGISDRRSKTCLACHGDSATAPVDMYDVNVLGGTGVIQDATKFVGLDLTDDHPIGVEVEIIPGNSMQPDPLILGRTTFPTTAPYATVECSRCHSVHGLSDYTINGRKLLYGPGPVSGGHPSTTDFCNICHTR